ncbi:MAG: hypothetical protein WBP45_14695 [Daejeonella sp.]
MEKQIWKFQFIVADRLSIAMPKDAEILTAQTQGGMACIWALINPENEKVQRYFEVFGTGNPIPCDTVIERKYIATFEGGGGRLVFHLFERIN